MAVMALGTEVGLSQSAFSQHLARMRDEKLVGFAAMPNRSSITSPIRVRQVLATLKITIC